MAADRLLESVLAVHNFVAAPGEAVVEVVPAVHLHVAAPVVDEDVVAGPADLVGRCHGVGHLGGVVTVIADQRGAVDVVGLVVVVAGVAADDGIAARAGRDGVVAGGAADEVVAAPV